MDKERGDLKPAVVFGMEMEEVECLEERIDELCTAHSLLPTHPLRHTDTHTHNHNHNREAMPGNAFPSGRE